MSVMLESSLFKEENGKSVKYLKGVLSDSDISLMAKSDDNNNITFYHSARTFICLEKERET